jgi:hypothetical protein
MVVHTCSLGLGRLIQEDHEFKISLGYITGFCYTHTHKITKSSHSFDPTIPLLECNKMKKIKPAQMYLCKGLHIIQLSINNLNFNSGGLANPLVYSYSEK